jgi:hypothetical protein
MKLIKILFSIFVFKALILEELEASPLVKNNFDIISLDDLLLHLKRKYVNN